MAQETKRLSAILLAFLVLTTNLTCVADLLSDGSCNWICKAETEHTKELQHEMMSKGRLVKLKFNYEERKHQTCANRVDANDTSASADVWLKKMNSSSKGGRIEFLTLTILEGFYSGQFLRESGFKEINVSCIYKSTTKPVTNDSLRLAFHTPQSVMYYVERLANSTERNGAFLTFIRQEKQTRVTLGVTATGTNNSLVPAQNKEVIVSDAWWFISIVTWIGFVLFSPAVLLFCRPSEITVNIVKVRRKQHIHVQESGREEHAEENDEGVRAESISTGPQSAQHAENPEVHATEHDDVGTNDVSPSIRTDYITALDQDVTENKEGTPTPFSMEVEKDEREDSEMVAPIKSKNSIFFVPLPNEKREDKEPEVVIQPRSQGLSMTLGTRLVVIDDRNEEQSCVAAKDSQDSATNDAIASTSTYAEPTAVSQQTHEVSENLDVGEIAGKSFRETVSRKENVPTSTAGTNVAAFSNSSDSEEQSRSDLRSETDTATVGGRPNDDGRISNDVTVSIPETLYHSSASNTQHTVSPEREENYARMIIAGGPCPVGIGSYIGNSFFSVMKGNVRKVVKTTILTFFPLVFYGFGDFLLVLLRKFHLQIASYFPNPYFASSVFNFLLINNHLALICLAVLSLICHYIRSLFVCGVISSNSPEAITWKPCFVHREHVKCYLYEGVQCFLSEFTLPKSLCNWNSTCQGGHRFGSACIVWQWLNDFCTSLQPCKDCKDSQPKCPNDLEVPENILHNLKKLPGIIIKRWNSLVQRFETIQIGCIAEAIFTPALVGVDILLSSPLVCLSYGRVGILNERFKDAFRGSNFVLPLLEYLIIVFSLFWITFLLVSGAVVIETAILGLIYTLCNHADKLLLHVTIVVTSFHYFWSCYKSFKIPYYKLVEKLFTSYQKKFDKLEEKGEVNELINYKQGEEMKLIPRNHFIYAREHKSIDMPVRNNVALLLVKLGIPLLLSIIVFPVIHAPTSELTHVLGVITFLTAYGTINSAYINPATSELDQEDVDEVVEKYIKSQQ